MNKPGSPTLRQVRDYWNDNPLCAAAIPHPQGTKEYFLHYDRLREENEPPLFSSALHEYSSFRGKRVLDVGCGNGYVLNRYAAEGAETYGIDLTDTGVALSRARFALAGRRGFFAVANAEELPFADGSLDCVCAMGVLHHTPAPERAVGEIRRVLRDGGRLIAMFYHRNSVWYRIGMSLASLRTGKSKDQLVNEVDGVGNPKGAVYSRRELRDLFSGFGELDTFTGLLRGWMIHPRMERLLPRRPAAFLERRFGWFLYVKGRKA